MYEIKQIKDQMAKTLDAMDACKQRVEQAETHGDDDARRQAVSEYDELAATFDALDAKAKTAEAHARRQARLARVNELPSPAAQALLSPAEPRDAQREQREHERLFSDWLTGKALGDRALTVLQPRSQGFTRARGGVALPPRLTKVLLGFQGKDLLPPMVSTQSDVDAIVGSDAQDRLLTLSPEPGRLFDRVRRVPAAAGQVLYPRLVQSDNDEFGGVAVNWTDEGNDKYYSEPQFDQLAISTHELAGQTQISRTLLHRSVIDLESFMGNEFRAAIADKLDQAILGGSGVSQPLGLLDASVTLREVNRGTADAVSYADLVEMEHSLRAYHRQNAVWVMGDDVMQSLKKQEDTQGRPLFVPSPATGAYNTLLGYPVITTHRLSLGNTGDVIFGDFRQYIAPVEQEIVLQKSEHRHMEKGVVLFVVFMLVGGRPAQERAFVKLAQPVV